MCYHWSDNYRNIVSQPGRDRWLDLYIQEVRDDIIKGLNKDSKMNITKQEDKRRYLNLVRTTHCWNNITVSE